MFEGLASQPASPDVQALLAVMAVFESLAKLEGWCDLEEHKDATKCKGVTVDEESGRVVGLALCGCELAGEIPGTEISELGELTSLDLDSNALTGEIPGELGQLSKLEFLRLSTNEVGTCK